MPKTSAGLVAYRRRERRIEVLLVHPGGPFWRGKDAGAWSIPKGEAEPGEDLLDAAVREFREETGFEPGAPFMALGPVRQSRGKVVHAFAFAGDYEPERVQSNTCQTEWPPRSGRMVEFPEVDRAAFFDLDLAKIKINPGQAPLLEELARRLGA
jgi:predicted NUDIX family NTP pyrophosphohydrolase